MNSTTASFKKLVAFRLLSENILIFLIQFTGLMFCVLGDKPLPFNFAVGTAAAFIFMRGYSILPGIWIGTFSAYLLSSGNVLSSAQMSSQYAAMTALLFWFSLKYISPSMVFFKRTLLLKFILLAAILCLLISSSSLEWLSNLSGLLTAGFAITTWDLYFPEMDKFSRMKWQFGWCTVVPGLFIVAFILNLAIYLGVLY